MKAFPLDSIRRALGSDRHATASILHQTWELAMGLVPTGQPSAAPSVARASDRGSARTELDVDNEVKRIELMYQRMAQANEDVKAAPKATHKRRHEAVETVAAPGGTKEEKTCPDCVVCCAVATHAILPCGHMCVCVGCKEALRDKYNRCPLCRGPVQSIVRIFT